VILKPFAVAFIALSLALCAFPQRAKAQGGRPVTILSNVVDLKNATRAIFSPDGALVATIVDTEVVLWDVASGGILRRMGHEAYLNNAVFSADGKWIIASFKDGATKLWDVTVNAPPITLQGKSASSDEAITSLWIEPDGVTLITGNDRGEIVVWDLAKRGKLRTIKFGKVPEGGGSRILALRVTADRQRVIAISQTSARLFDLKSGKTISAFDLPNKYPLWEAKEKNVFAAGSIVSDDGLLVMYSTPDCEIEEIKLLNLADTKELLSIDKSDTCKRPEDKYSFLSPSIFSSPSRPTVIIARSGALDFREWDPKTRSVVRTVKWTEDADAELIGIDQGFTTAASLNADTLRIRNLEKGTDLRSIRSTEDATEFIAVARDGRSMMLVQDASNKQKEQKQVTLWQVGAMDPKSMQFTTNADANIIDFSAEAKLAVAVNSNGEIVLFSTETANELRRFSVAGVKNPERIRLSADGKFAAMIGEANNEKVAVLVDTSDGSVKRQFGGRDQRNGVIASTGRDDDSDFVTTVAFSPDGKKLALGRFNGTAEIWDTQTGRRLKSLPASRDNSDQIWSVAFTTDGKKLIAGSRDSGAFLWDAETGRMLRTFLYEGLAGHVHLAGVAVSHDGATVIGGLAMHAVSSGDAGPERGIKVWNAATGKLRFTLREHDGGIGGLAFSADDRWIISASFDSTIRYWDRNTGRLAATFRIAKSGRWFVLADGGFFAAQAGGEDLLTAARGFKSIPAAKFREQLYRPDLIEALLKGDPQRRYPAALRDLDLGKVWDKASP
jgi:WD40 repeat protein